MLHVEERRDVKLYVLNVTFDVILKKLSIVVLYLLIHICSHEDYALIMSTRKKTLNIIEVDGYFRIYTSCWITQKLNGQKNNLM